MVLGEHQLTIIYAGDNKYINQTIKTKFNIKNETSKITTTTSNITYGENIIVMSSVTPGAEGSVTFIIKNQSQTINLTNGQAKAIFTNIPAGNHIVTAKYNGDKVHQGSNSTSNVNVKKASPSLTVNISPLLLNENIKINALLNNDASGNVTFTIQGLYSPRNITIINGVSLWLISPLGKGSYNLIVTYNGDNNYEPITFSKLILNQNESILKVNININAEDDLIVYATLTDYNNQKLNGLIVIEINGVSYNVFINNGVGSRNLGEFKVGDYTYTAIYAGSDLLSAATTTGSFNVKTNNYKIIGNMNIVQYYGANKYYKVRLLNNNVPVKNAIVTVKINKNTVNVRTDSKGYATLTLFKSR